ncbi:MAG: type II secretion system protein [Campylobacterales bacterium]|nr:type II secretion system protein [Campylobacterales bacterium]
MVIVATIGAYIMNFSALSTRQTTDTYFREQAMLFAKSGTELALLVISGNDHSQNCIDEVHFQYPADCSKKNDNCYEVNVSIRYWYVGSFNACQAKNALMSEIQTVESNGTVLMDIFVKTPAIMYDDEGNATRYTFHRRTIQKP